MKGNSNSKKTTEEKKNEISVSRKNDLLTLLPIKVKESKELTINHKLVLAYLIEFNNIDKAKDNGYIYRTNDVISQETGVCLNTLRSSFTKLTDLGFIERTAGHRGKASEYRLHMSMIKSYGSKAKSYGSKFEDEDCTNKLNPNYNDLLLIINELRNEVKSYRSKVEEYKNEVEEYKMKLHPIFENCTTDTDIDKEIETISKDNLLDNNNTEGRNSKEKNNIKEKSTKDNLEILKENSTVEIPNDEDIQRENESLDEDKDNISKVKSSDNGNLNESRIPSESRIETRDNISTDNISDNGNLDESRISDLVDMYFNQTNIPNDNIPSESRIPSDEGNISDNENPNDMPPLDVDSFFENPFNLLTEYRTNENPSESRIPSDDGRIETRDNIPHNENSKADEIDCSVFGNETFDSDTISKTQNLVPRCVDGRFVVVEDNISNDENFKNNNLKTSENMKKTKISKGEISNKGKISKKANSSNSFIHFGRLVGVCDMKGNVEEYLFNAYDTLKTADDFSEKFTETTEMTIDLTQLEVSQDCGSGVWGMLSFNNGEYSFTQSNVNTHYSEKVTQSCAAETAETSNNAPQATETSKVDNHTTEGEIIAPVQPQNTNKASEGNTNTTADNKEDENTVESPSEDTPKTEIPSDDNDTQNNALQGDEITKVDNCTANEEITAGNSVKMRPEASDEKIDTTAEWNNIELFIITSYRTVRSLIEELSEIPVTNLESFSLAYSPLDYQMSHKYKQTMTSDEWNSFTNTLKNVTDRFFKHWAEVFSTRQPSSNFYEQQMYGLVQNNHQQSTATVNDTTNNGAQASISSKVGNNTTNTEITAPVQSPIVNKPSESNAAPLPNSIKAWEKVNIYSHIDKKTYTMNEGFEIYKSLAAKDIHNIMTWMKDFCDTMRMAKDNNIITEEQFNDFHNVFNALSRGKKKYWYNTFCNREPRKTMTSEMQMWEYLAKPKVNKTVDNKTVDNNKTYEDNVILPTHKDFETMNLDDIKNHLLSFVQEHPNLSDDKKKYVNDLCMAYALEPQYVA